MSLAKENAAKAALTYVKSNMKIGLGTGSTAAIFVDLLGEKVAQGLNIIAVPTSKATQKQAEALNIPLTTLEAVGGRLDLTIDGTDEVSPDGHLIKGGGGALLREKIVAAASDKMIVIADVHKKVAHLGQFPLPIEIIPFGAASTLSHVENCLKTHFDHGVDIKLRQAAKGGELFITDEGNYILDASCLMIANPQKLHDALNCLTGVVENGLFMNMASHILIGHDDKVKVF